MLHLAKPPPLKPLSVNGLTIFRLPEPSLYRLISLTSPVVRLFESIVKGGICDHLYSHPLLSTDQDGFVPGRSCTILKC